MKDREVLKKHNGAIHVSNKHLSLLQRKLFNVLVWRAYPHLKSQEEYDIKLSSLPDMIGFESKNIPYLQKALKKLSKIDIEWNLMEDGGDVWGFANLLGDCEIKAGICTYSIPPKLRRLLYQPEIYTLLKLSITKLFKSKHSLALYENIYRYANTDAKTTGWMEIGLFRKLIGAESRFYDNFAELKRRVIIPAIDEVNDVSNIILKAEYQRKGRKVYGIKFAITMKEGCPTPAEPPQEELVTAPVQQLGEPEKPKRKPIDKAVLNLVLEPLMNLVPEQHRDKETIVMMVTVAILKHGQEYTRRNILYTNAHHKQNYRAYLAKALEADWGKTLEEDEATKQAEAEKIRQEEEEARAKIRQAEAEREMEKAKELKAKELLKAMSEQDKAALRGRALKELHPALRRNEQSIKTVMLSLIMEQQC